LEGIRDLARNELWEESLERSRARREAARPGARVQREKPRRARSERETPRRVRAEREKPRRVRPEREMPRSERETPRRVRAERERPLLTRSERPRSTRSEEPRSNRRRLVPAGAVLLALALLLVVFSGTFGGSSRTERVAARAQSVRPEQGGPTDTTSDGVAPVPNSVLSGRGPAHAPRSCHATVGSSNYFNPLAAAKVTPERIDQGVDYAGTGTLGAIGAARITYVATTGTGWPGAFIAYRLLDGTDAGCYVFYAEGVKPVPGLRVGQIVGPGQPVATLIPGWATGIELGWGAGFKTVTYAAAKHQWSARSDAESVATAAGKSFSALIHALGGPPGKLEG
jgi:hypothetical protein